MSAKYDYNERPKLFKETDFWKQVRRTVNGEDVAPEQIDLIVAQVINCLQLSHSDLLLDVGCGNGALTSLFKPYVNSILGVDPSEYLIDIARKYFEFQNITYTLGDNQLINDDSSCRAYNKILMYGVSSFLTDVDLSEFISILFSPSYMCSTPLKRLMIGNIRDIDKHPDFLRLNPTIDQDPLDITTSMGKWRSKDWFNSIALRLNLNIDFFKMPESFYASYIYYDVVFSAK